MNTIREQIDALRGERLADMTLGEARDKMRRLQALERELEAASRFSAIVIPEPGMEQAREAPCALQEGGYGQAPVRPAYGAQNAPCGAYTQPQAGQGGIRRPKPEKKPRLSEMNVGRYVMTVLAALLCLGAFCAFVFTFWSQLPDVGKFAIFLALGVGLEALGAWRADKNSMRPFWLGVSGLGAGIIYIDIIIGCLFWGVFDILMTGVCIILWAAVNMRLGRRQNAGVYYIISYLGGLQAVGMASGNLVCDSYSETAVILLAAAIAASGLLAFKQERKQYLLVLGILYLCAVSGIFIEMSMYIRYSGGNATELFNYGSGYVPMLFPWFAVLFATLALHLAAGFLNLSFWRFKILLKSASVLGIGCLIFAGCEAVFWSDAAGYVAALVLLAAPVLLYQKQGVWLGTVLPFCMALSGLSAVITDGSGVYDGLLPAVLVLVLAAWSRMTKTWDDRLAAAVAYVAAFSGLQAYWNTQEVLFYAMGWVLMNVAVLVFMYQSWKQDSWVRIEYEMLLLLVQPGLLLSVLIGTQQLSWLPDVAVSVFVLIGLYGYYFLLLKDREADGLPMILWYGARGVFYTSLIFGCGFYSDTPGKLFVTVGFMAALCFNAYMLTQRKGPWQAVATCLLCNQQMLCLAGIWGLAEYNILVSLLGFVIAAGFIAFGFYYHVKPSRQAGLGCAILYAVKMGLFDIGGRSSLAISGGLLVAGLLCFGISFVYNKLGRREQEYLREEAAREGQTGGEGHV